MGGPPAIHPYQEYINYLEDVVIFNLRQELASSLASPDPTSTNGDDGGYQTNGGDDEHQL
jgi:hypothetical protein